MSVSPGDKLKIPASGWNRAIDMVKHVGVSAPSNTKTSRRNGIVIDPDLFIPTITGDDTTVTAKWNNNFSTYCVNTLNGIEITRDTDNEDTSFGIQITTGEVAVCGISLLYKISTSTLQARWVLNGIGPYLTDDYACLGVIPIFVLSASDNIIEDEETEVQKLAWSYRRLVDRPIHLQTWLTNGALNIYELSIDATPYWLG